MKSKRYIYIVVIALAICVIVVFIGLKIEQNSTKTFLKVQNQKISLLVASTLEDRTKGLSGQESLPADEALLFIFPEPDYYGIWMKEMNFSIDIIWLDVNKKIVQIKKDVSPATYPSVFFPSEKNLYIIETVANFSDKNNLEVGMVLDF